MMMSDIILCKVPVQDSTDICCVCGSELKNVGGRYYFFFTNQASIAKTIYHQCPKCEIYFKTFKELEDETKRLTELTHEHVEVEKFLLLDRERDKKEAKRLNRGRIRDLSPLHEIFVREIKGDYGGASTAIETMLLSDKCVDKLQLFALLYRICEESEHPNTYKHAVITYADGLSEEQIEAIKQNRFPVSKIRPEIDLSDNWLQGNERPHECVVLANNDEKVETNNDTVNKDGSPATPDAQKYGDETGKSSTKNLFNVFEEKQKGTQEYQQEGAQEVTQESTQNNATEKEITYFDLSRFAPYMRI